MIIVSVGIHLIRLVPRHLPPEGKAMKPPSGREVSSVCETEGAIGHESNHYAIVSS